MEHRFVADASKRSGSSTDFCEPTHQLLRWPSSSSSIVYDIHSYVVWHEIPLEGLWREWHLIESRNILTPKEANFFVVLRNLMPIIAR